MYLSFIHIGIWPRRPGLKMQDLDPYPGPTRDPNPRYILAIKQLSFFAIRMPLFHQVCMMSQLGSTPYP